MNIELLISIISGVFALIAGIIAVLGQRSNTKLSNELELLKIEKEHSFKEQKEIDKYKEPLIRASYDLQSRLYNILMMDLFGAYYKNGDKREQNYVIDSTLFLLAQYFCWTEIIRNEIQFIDLGEDKRTKELSDLINKITQTFLTDEYEKPFRIFTGEQRALGEIMISIKNGRTQCIGYHEFTEKYTDYEEDSIFKYLREDILTISSDTNLASERLIRLQNYLIDLIDYLDPDHIRHPKKYRTKINLDTVT